MTLDLVPTKALPTKNRDKTPYPHLGLQSPSGSRSSASSASSSCCSFSSSRSSIPSIDISSLELPSDIPASHTPVASGNFSPAEDDDDDDDPVIDRAHSQWSARKFFWKLGKIVLVFLMLQASWAAGAVLSLLPAVAFAVNVLLLMTAAL